MSRLPKPSDWNLIYLLGTDTSKLSHLTDEGEYIPFFLRQNGNFLLMKVLSF